MISRESSNSSLIRFKKAFYKIVLLSIFAFSSIGATESLFVIHTYEKEDGLIMFVDKDSIKFRDDRLVSFWTLTHFEPKLDDIGSAKESYLADCREKRYKTLQRVIFDQGMGQGKGDIIKYAEDSAEWKEDRTGFFISYPCRKIYRKYKDEYNLDWK